MAGAPEPMKLGASRSPRGSSEPDPLCAQFRIARLSESGPAEIRLMAGASFRPHVGRGCAVTPAKSPVEIGQVIEAEFERDRADLAVKIERVSQKAVSA